MLFSARKVRAEKQVDRKESLISRNEVINLLKEAINSFGDSTSKQKFLLQSELLTISNNYYLEQKQRECKSMNFDLDSRDKEIIVPFFYEFEAKNIFLQPDLLENEKMKMAEKWKFIQIYNEKETITIPTIGRFNQNHSRSIRKAAQLIRMKLQSRSTKEEDQLYQSIKNELRSIQNKADVYEFLIKFIREENQLKLNTIFSRDENYQQYLNFLKEYLSEMVQIVCSTAFQLFNEGKLTENQLKAYASKNILQNIRIILVETKKAFEQAGKQHGSQLDINYSQELMIRITKDIDRYLQISLGELSAHYPQASGGGQTVRMRQAILKINRAEDQTNDLIFIKNIKISKYSKRQNEDKYLKYSGFIMEVINAAINSTRQEYSEGSNQTVFQKFYQFSEKLFVINRLSEHQKYKNELKTTDIRQFNKLSKFYQNIFQDLKKEYPSDVPKQNPLSGQKGNFQKQSILGIENIQSIYDEQCGAVRNQHKYAIGQKISNEVRPFAENQIKSKTFLVKNSSILRIMTKWVQYLEQFFENPQLMIKKRIYNFKNIENQLCNLLKDSQRDQKQKLCNNLKQQGLYVKEQFNQLKSKNTIFQSFFLSYSSSNASSFLKKFTQARVASSSINAILIQFTHEYLCVLIHHLLKAGKDICDEQTKIQDINLISLRVGDLLRSKMECNESSFLNIVKTLNFLDERKQMKGIFKLVRVKNKLNQRDNNILINYLFLGKVQCELQLSIQNMKSKQKNYYSFCHFLYELTRGQFGVITELSTIVCQHDPIVNSIKQVMYNPKRYSKWEKDTRKLKENYQKDDRLEKLSLKIHKKDKHYYICPKCRKIKVNQNIYLFKQEQINCNQCTIAQIMKQSFKVQAIVQKMCNKHSQIIDYLVSQQQYLSTIRNYNQFQALKNTKAKYSLVFSLRNENNIVNLKPFMIYYHEREFQYFKIELSTQILTDYRLQLITYQEMDYINITDSVLKGANLNEIIFIQTKQADLHLPGNISIIIQSCEKYARKFHRFRLQKSIIKQIRSKGQIVDLGNDKTKIQHIQCLKSLNTLLIVTKTNTKEKINKKIPKNKQNVDLTTNCIYNKFTTVSPQNIKKLQLPMIGLTDAKLLSFISKDVLQLNLSNNLIVKFQLKQAKQLKILRVVNNKMKQLNISHNIHLNEIYGTNNDIEKVDLTQNKQLTLIDLNENFLAQINLSQNSLLNDIHLANNKLNKIIFAQNNRIKNLTIGGNKLKQIDLTNSTALTALNLYSCQLIKIDLSNNQDLNVVYLDNNQIESLDLSNNQKLHLASLRNNNISKIDLSKNYELQNLDISHNNLKEIDLSQNSKLDTLMVSANSLEKIQFPLKSKLKTFRSNTNCLKQIDLSKNSQLVYLDLASNQLSQINLESNNQIVAVDLRQNKLTQVKLSKCKELNTLCLLSNSLTSIDLSENINLTDLYLNKNSITYLDLSKNNQIYNAYLNNNQISQIILPTEGQSLSTLNLNHNKLTRIDVSKHRQLRSFLVANNNLKSIDFSANDQLIIIDVSRNQIESISLTSYGQLNSLNLQGNLVKCLAIPQDLQLERIDLSGNPLESFTIFYKKNLRSVNLRNIISDAAEITLMHRKGQSVDCEVFKRSLQQEYDKESGYTFKLNQIE